MADPNVIVVPATGPVSFAGKTYECALGRSGVRATKQEGDGVSPQGVYALRSVLYRPDRIDPPRTILPVSPIGENNGWCDDPHSPDYNQPIVFPFTPSAEHLWRDDHLYDVIVLLGHNDDPVVPGAGSAIFMHVASDSYSPTEGCVALAQEDLLAILADCTPDTVIAIGEDH